MKLGIFGDSFADINCPDISYHKENSKPWPKTLSMLMSIDADFFGQSSTSNWYSYEKFIQNYKKYNYIVFCYTDYNRWHSISDIELIGLSNVITEQQIISLENHKDNFVIESAKKLVAAHPILYSHEFNIFVYQTIFDNVNKLCKENNIKIVNVMPFETIDSISIDVSNRSGTCITGLRVLSRNEMLHTEYTEVAGNDVRYCHLNPENNNLLAESINELWATPSMIEIT